MRYIVAEDYNIPEDLGQEWSQWLDDNFDPGHYDPFKRDGKWVCDTYLPTHLEKKFIERGIVLP